MNLFDIDIIILKFFNQPFSPYLNFLFVFITYSVYGYLILLLYIYFKKNDKKRLFHIILSLIVGIILVNILKYSIGRPRPYVLYPEINKILTKADPSFPSAHVFISFLCFYFLPKKSTIFRKLSMLYLLLLIPVGSMYTGVHYPSDIIAGAIIGLLIPKIISEKMTNKLANKFFK